MGQRLGLRTGTAEPYIAVCSKTSAHIKIPDCDALELQLRSRRQCHVLVTRRGCETAPTGRS
jgi:hypothetical protein